jgi:hypothetical protein
MSARHAVRICLRPEHLRSTVTIALVVGTILMAINQLDVIISGEATAITWIKVGATYCVPFVVSNLGLLAGKRSELKAAASGPDQWAPNARTPEAARPSAGRRRG